jgi:hypothetical protein
MKRSLSTIALTAVAALALGAGSAGAQPRVHHAGTAQSAALQGCSGSYETFRVRDEVSIPAAYLARLERAVAIQSLQVRREWKSPCARFSTTGVWPIYIMWSAVKTCDLYGAPGCHGPAPGSNATDGTDGIPTIWLGIHDTGYSSWTIVFSGEVLRSLVDPYCATVNGSSPVDPDIEIPDPVAFDWYRSDAIKVSDWTFPLYWRHPFASGRMDYMGVLG